MEANFRLLANGYVGIVSVFLGSGANVNTQKACTAISLEIRWFINMKRDCWMMTQSDNQLVLLCIIMHML